MRKLHAVYLAADAVLFGKDLRDLHEAGALMDQNRVHDALMALVRLSARLRESGNATGHEVVVDVLWEASRFRARCHGQRLEPIPHER